MLHQNNFYCHINEKIKFTDLQEEHRLFVQLAFTEPQYFL
jgi:hypothetical protein